MPDLSPDQAKRTSAMRVAIVSPYSWTYAGGVNRHVEALAEALLKRGLLLGGATIMERKCIALVLHEDAWNVARSFQ